MSGPKILEHLEWSTPFKNASDCPPAKTGPSRPRKNGEKRNWVLLQDHYAGDSPAGALDQFSFRKIGKKVMWSATRLHTEVTYKLQLIRCVRISSVICLFVTDLKIPHRIHFNHFFNGSSLVIWIQLQCHRNAMRQA